MPREVVPFRFVRRCEYLHVQLITGNETTSLVGAAKITNTHKTAAQQLVTKAHCHTSTTRDETRTYIYIGQSEAAAERAKGRNFITHKSSGER